MKKFILSFSVIIGTFASAQHVKEERIKTIVSTLAADDMKGRKVGTEGNLKAAQYIAEQFKNNQLDYCFGTSYLVPFTYKGETAYNVCGIQKGTSGNYIGLGAHFDHIGESKKDQEDKIFNGADDNASGVSAVIGISDYFKKKKVKDGLVFMAFNAEEVGLVGSKELANDAQFEPIISKMKLLLNFEMLGSDSAFGPNSVYMTGDDKSNLDEEFNRLSKDGLKIVADPYLKQQLFYRSDNVNFVNKNIVGHSFSTVNMETQKHYHRVNDEVEFINIPNLTKLTNSFAKTIEAYMKDQPKIEFVKKP